MGIYWGSIAPPTSRCRSLLTYKLWISLSYVLSSAFVYSALRLLIPSQKKYVHYIACSVGLFVYMLNQVVISELIVPHMLLSYSAIPLFSALFVKVIQQGRYKGIIRYLVGIALTTPFLSIYPPSLFFAIIFALFYIVYRTLKYRATFLIKDMGRSTLTLCVFFASNSYWILPLLYQAIYHPATTSSLYTHSPFSLQELSIHTGILNTAGIQ